MLLMNCDLGEHGVANIIDDELVKYIDIANIACGGHAGDKQSVEHYVNLCAKHNVKITAHISYPDKENFGRKVIQIDDAKLLQSFDKQLQLFDNIQSIKPHGALYNELNVNEKLSNLFITWCLQNNINELVLSPNGIVKKVAEQNGIKILNESFAERGYMLNAQAQPALIPRGQKNAELTNVDDALNQFRQLNKGFISVDSNNIPFVSETICIHSDSEIAVDLAKKIHGEIHV